jgi:hypothetical protein
VRWHRASKYHEVSDKMYAVCAARSSGKWRFTAFAPKKQGDIGLLGSRDTADEARELCNLDHINKQ